MKETNSISQMLGTVDIAPLKEIQGVLDNLKGTPLQDRLLLMVHTGEKSLSSGIILTSQVKEDLPKRGVVVKIGPVLDEDTRRLVETHIDLGSVVTYGLYAGKEVNPLFKEGYDLPENYKLVVLSLNEVIFVEPHPEH